MRDGDRIIVDTARRVPATDGLYVPWDGTGLPARPPHRRIRDAPSGPASCRHASRGMLPVFTPVYLPSATAVAGLLRSNTRSAPGSSSVQTGATPPGQSDTSSVNGLSSGPRRPGSSTRGDESLALPCRDGASPPSARFPPIPSLTPLTTSLNSVSGLNAGTFDAGITTLSPVRGLQPVRADRLFVVNVPNPAILTAPSFTSASAIASSTLGTAPSGTDLMNPILSATRPTIFDLFTASPPETSVRPACAGAAYRLPV